MWGGPRPPSFTPPPPRGRAPPDRGRAAARRRGRRGAGAGLGTVRGGGYVTSDRAIQLRLRTPQWNISRGVEQVINTRFQQVADKQRQNGQGQCVAEAQDEGYINLYVPAAYQNNWEHF